MGHSGLTPSATTVSVLRFRYYSTSTGRWLSRDPLGEAGGLNLYGFVDGNAISLCDKDGLRKYDFSEGSYPFTFSFGAGDVIITPDKDTINVFRRSLALSGFERIEESFEALQVRARSGV